MSYNKIESNGAILLFNTLKKFDNLKSVVLFKNQINDSCIESLCEVLSNNVMLAHIDLGKNNITDVGVEILFRFLNGSNEPKNIRLSENKGITNKSIPFILDAIDQDSVSDIAINGTSIGGYELIHVENIRLFKKGQHVSNYSGK